MLISSGFSLNLTVCALLVVKRAKDDEIPMDLDLTPQQRRKSLKSWSGYYYFSHQLYCVDEDAEKREFFWNIKNLVSIPACPVDYEDYEMNANNTFATDIDEITKNNTIKNSSIKDGVVLTVEGLNNEAYESSTDNLENGHYVQFEIPKPKMDNETYEISKDNFENPHYLQFEVPKTTTVETTDETSKGNCANGRCVEFEIPETKTNDETYEMSEDNSENPHYLQFEIPKTAINETTDELSNGDCANGHFVQFEIPKTAINETTDEPSNGDCANGHFVQFEIPKTAINEDISEMSENSENGNYLQFEVPKPKLNSDEVKEKTEDIINNTKAVQNGINTKSVSNDNKKVKIKFQKENTVKKSVKEKLKLLYTNVSFVLLLISLSMFLFGTSIVFTHILPYAESENVSSSIGLLLVSVLGGAGLAGKIGLGAIAQLPRVNPIVLYIIAVFLCGTYIHYSPQIKIDLNFVLPEG